MSSNGSLRAVIFDYGKVLSLPPTEADWAALAAAAGVPYEKFAGLYWGHRDAYDRREVSAAEYWALVAGGPLTENRLTELIAMDDAQWTKENTEMIGLARELKESGLKTAVLSNMQSDMLKVLRAKFGWLSEFDVQMYSCEVGMVKPTPEIYLECARRLGVHPAQSLFLDDKQPNIDGAERAGLHGLLFNGERSEAERELEKLGVKL